MIRMHTLGHRVTATLAAAALALGGLAATTAPANASDRDLLRFLAGAATIAIIAKGVSDHNRRGQAQAAPLPEPVRPGAGRPGNHRPPHVAPVRLPQDCGARYRVRGQGVLTYYGERCLQRSGIQTAALPQSCRQQVQTNRGPRPAFQGVCLQQAGFRTARQ
jgi:hypothetical protein